MEERLVPPIVLMTSEKYYWALKPFSYLFNLFWRNDYPVAVVCTTIPDFPLPDNFHYNSISDTPCPAEHWSDSLIAFLSELEYEHVILMLEDYWLLRQVDLNAIYLLDELMYNDPMILRADLTADRLFAYGDSRNARDYIYFDYLDIITTENDVAYQMSLQAGMWNRQNLLKVLQPNKSPWEIEMHTHVPNTMKVVGTRQVPVRYANAIAKGHIDENELEKIPEPHRSYIRRWIPRDWLVSVKSYE